MRRIILIGYMGSGKTTVGKALSKETGMMMRIYFADHVIVCTENYYSYRENGKV